VAVYIGPKKRAKSTFQFGWDELDPRLKPAFPLPVQARPAALPNGVPYNPYDPAPEAVCDVADIDWDEIDLMIMGPKTARATTRRKRSGAERRIGIYARYSSDRQKPTSIEIQVRDGVRYIRSDLNGAKHTIFRDDARTGTNTNRQGLQALLEAVAGGLIDVVVIWSFDRLSRETYDGVPVIRFLEMHDVELHIIRKGRKVTKREAITDAVQAEEENAVRTEFMGNGLDDLVRKGGLPWGRHYGLQPTRRRGFPEHHPDQRPVVERITRDVVHKSGDAIADELNADGVPSPEGKAPWNGAAVLAIAQNIANTGRIHFRATGMHYNVGTKAWERKSNPKHNLVKGFNPDIVLVKDHEFISAVQAIRARDTRKGGRIHDKSNHALPVFGNPICDCPDRNEKQSFQLNYVDERKCSHRYACCNGGERCCSDAQSFMGDPIEKAIFDVTAPRLATRLEGYDGELKDSLAEIDSGLAVRRDAETSILNGLREQSQRLMLLKISDAHDMEDRDALAEELKRQRRVSERRLALIPEIAVDDIDFDGVRETLSTALTMLRGRIPFVPHDCQERELVGALRKGVLGIRISRAGRLRGSFGISIAVQWERYVLSEAQVLACDFQPKIIETECHLEPSYTNVGSVSYMSELAAAGLHALSGAQWELVKDRLPDLSITESGGLRISDTRKIVHLLIFMARMKVPLTRPPAYFGPAKEAYNAVLRLVLAGGIEILQRTLASDPTWSEGPDFSRFDKLRRSKHSTQPTLAAARAAGRGEYDLTDEQWASIAHLFVERLSKPSSGRPVGIDMRTAMDGVLTKLRTGCGYKKMPERFGGGRELLNITQRIHYHGVWHAARDMLRERFPEVLEGLPADPFPNWALRRKETSPPARR
jgi:DNA invertase Pin-like site-specific DNA recombinase/transposase